MLKFIHLFKNFYLGISFVGIAAFVIQEIPYIVMPLIKPTSNPIMNMTNEIQWIETVQGIFGIWKHRSMGTAFYGSCFK